MNIMIILITFFIAIVLARRPSMQQDGANIVFVNWSLTNGTLNLDNVDVPGDVYTAMEKKKVIGDPRYRYNDAAYFWAALGNWSYKATFSIELSPKLKLAQSLSSSNLIYILELSDIDTVADVELNGAPLARLDDQFRRYFFDISDHVAPQQNNDLLFRFKSPVLAANATARQYPYAVPSSQYINPSGRTSNRQFIRKEQDADGWDWGPAFSTTGIYTLPRVVVVDGSSSPPFQLIDLETQVTPSPVGQLKTWNVCVRPILLIFKRQLSSFLAAYGDGVDVVVRVANVVGRWNATIDLLRLQRRAAPETDSFELRLDCNNVLVDSPVLWQVRGTAPSVDVGRMYNLTVEVAAGRLQMTRRIGFRSVELVTNPLPNGESFFFRVNGRPLYAKGSNFIPISSFHTRVSPAAVRQIIDYAAQANMNMIRVWGGGIYQWSSFYDTCDDMGLLVWQEFMFACALYPTDKHFLTNVAAEVTDQVRRLMHHPSIALWSGNNENEGALTWYVPSQEHRDTYLQDYVHLYLDVVRPALLRVDESRPFWPSSPSNGPLAVNRSREIYTLRYGDVSNVSYGDVHKYLYGKDCWQISIYPRARFVSEYGLQSWPSAATWEAVTIASDRSKNSTFMQQRNHHPDGNEQMHTQMALHFRVPSDDAFDDYVHVSQVSQALCISRETEYYRRLRADASVQTMGALYWQFNSIWQAQTWSSLEFSEAVGEQRWKVLHYDARRFFAPLLISAELKSDEDRFEVFVTNDFTSRQGRWSVKFLQWSDGRVAKAFNGSYDVGESTQRVLKLRLSAEGVDKKLGFMHMCLDDDLDFSYCNDYYFDLKSLPTVTVTITNVQWSSAREAEVTLLSKGGVAPYFFIESSQASCHAVQNNFALLPGTTKVAFKCEKDVPTTTKFNCRLI